MDKYGNKNFDTWNELKKQIENGATLFCNKREVWWCLYGENIGSEECGKDALFERPVLVLRVFNQNLAVIVPITSRPKKDKFHERIFFAHKPGWAILSQIRTISTKRLRRRIDKMNSASFGVVLKACFKLLSE